MVKVNSRDQSKMEVLTNINRSKMTLDFALRGAIYINDVATKTGPFFAIQGINNCKLDFTSGGTVGTGMEDFDVDFVIPNGAIIYGNFKTVKTAAGGPGCDCIAYKGE